MHAAAITPVTPTLTRSLQPILETLPVKKYKKDNIILYQGEVPRYGFFLASGTVTAYNVTSAGEQQIIAYKKAGDIFDESWLFKNTSGSLYFYEASSDCDIQLVQRDVFLQHIQEDVDSLNALVAYFAKNYTGMLLQINSLEQTRARDKVSHMLHHLAQRYGSRRTQGLWVIDLRLTQQHIANLCGLTRETTATELNRLKRQGIVQYRHYTYEVNLPKLLASMGEDSFEMLLGGKS
jgi:CRP-like cAMP-binding protein